MPSHGRRSPRIRCDGRAGIGPSPCSASRAFPADCCIRCLVPTHLMAVVALGSADRPADAGAMARLAPMPPQCIAGLGAIALGLRADAGGGGRCSLLAASAGLLVALARPLPRRLGVLLAGGERACAGARIRRPRRFRSATPIWRCSAPRSARRSCCWSLLQVTSRLHARLAAHRRAHRRLMDRRQRHSGAGACGSLARRSRPCAARPETARG